MGWLGRALADTGAISASDLSHVDAFFALPQEARLAKVRSSYGSGTEIAHLIGCAVDHQLKEGKVSAIDLFEIISDYVNRTEFKTRYGQDNESYDGFTEYGRGKDVDALWRLVLKVPEYISDVLIKNLPPGAGLSSRIPEDVLSGMSDGQLTTLFNREDIHLEELRKKHSLPSVRSEMRLRMRRSDIILTLTTGTLPQFSLSQRTKGKYC